MPLLTLKQACLAFGNHVLLDSVDFVLQPKQRVGLLGRNGAGKSTLLSVIAGSTTLDSGERWCQDGVQVAYLSQSLPAADEITVFDFVANGLAGVGELLSRYHSLAHEAATDSSGAKLDALAKVQQQLEACDGWALQQKVETTLDRLELDPDARLANLSGGWRRRVSLAQALVCEPDVLLLDEPTNHLDIAAIEWLEQALQNFNGAILVITHDRRFLQNVASTMLELDRGNLLAFDGSYEGFLAHREQQLAAEEKARQLFDKKLAEEERWIRQGIKARRTRNEGRVRALERMREERSERREQQGRANFKVGEGEASGKRVLIVDNISYGIADRKLVDNFSLVVQRGDRIGLLGPNGVGKSTLLKLLLGKLQPQAGKVQEGTRLQVAYFDQLRDSLDLEKSVIDNLSEGRDFIEVNNERKHVISWLQDFLFTPERARQPVRALSGGEQNRLILAILFSKPANLLVMDEPTNDLDLETLELLEELLLDFSGTLLLVSHDRSFLDNVVTSCLAFEGEGKISEHVGGYSDFLRWQAREKAKLAPVKKASSAPQASAPVTPAPAAGGRKLSYKLQRELEQLPVLIEKLEAEQAQLQAEVSGPEFYQLDHAHTAARLQALADVDAQLEEAYARWEALEGEE